VIYDSNHWKDVYTGIKWQCVEYARRWLLIKKGATFGDVDIAADIWNKINHLTDISTDSPLPLESHVNGSEQPPQVGDLLVYASEFQDTGHVAVVIETDFDDGVIEVAEQNYTNEPWTDDYSRKIELVRHEGNYWLLDKYLLGWKHLKK
jgi:glutathionylspermidine amidase/synthetase